MIVHHLLSSKEVIRGLDHRSSEPYSNESSTGSSNSNLSDSNGGNDSNPFSGATEGLV